MKIGGWDGFVESLAEHNPYDYSTYIKLLYDYEKKPCLRKMKAAVYALTRIYRLGMYRRHKYPPGRESTACRRSPVQEVLRILKDCDVVSFDVFDTLLLRNLLDCGDVFCLTGMKLGISGFKELRERAQREAAWRKKAAGRGVEVTLSEIYEVVSEWQGLDVQTGMEAELSVERAVCRDNPYWHEVFDSLRADGKRIVIVTDMYLSRQTVRALLVHCGYEMDHVEVFVSCEEGANKRDGTLFSMVRQRVGNDAAYIHIGDNRAADIRAAKRAGWSALYYKDVHSAGKYYRHFSKSIIPASVCGGILDAQLHSGKVGMSALEEFGFCYYGPLAVGYCDWLAELASHQKIDKFLFVSRDGYLLREIWEKHFGAVPGEYVVTSRHALTQINVQEGMELFLQQNIIPQARKHELTMGALLHRLQLGEMVPFLGAGGLREDVVLCRENLDTFIRFLFWQKRELCRIYEESVSAAEKYFHQVVGNCERVCVVDVGWQGTSCLGIHDFLKKHMGWQGEVIGAQIGTKYGEQNIEFLARNQIFSYAFTPDQNRELYRDHGFGLCSVVDEIVFSAPGPSLLRYRLNRAGEPCFEFMQEPDRNRRIVKEVQEGVKKFADLYCGLMKELGLAVSLPAASVYKPLLGALHNRRYIMELFGMYEVQRETVGDMSDGKTLWEIYGKKR